MTTEEIRQITTERLDSWKELSVSEHATPVALVSVGHDAKSGNLVVCVPEDMKRADVIVLLRGALKLLRG